MEYVHEVNSRWCFFCSSNWESSTGFGMNITNIWTNTYLGKRFIYDFLYALSLVLLSLYSLGGLGPGLFVNYVPFQIAEPPRICRKHDFVTLPLKSLKSWPSFKNKRWCRLEIIVSHPEIHLELTHKNSQELGPFRTYLPVQNRHL